MSYEVVSQSNTVTTLADDQGNIVHVPAIAALSTSSDFTIVDVNNSTATLEDGNGNTYRDIPCIVVLADDSSSYSVTAQKNTKTTLQNENNNVVHVPAKVILAKATDFTLIKVNNSTATLEDESGNVYRDVPCVSMLADEQYTISKVNNSIATLENSNGNIVRDIPCVVVLVKTSGGVEVTIKGVAPLILPDALAGEITSLIAFGGTEHVPQTYLSSVVLDGGTEQSGTPTPDAPMNIVCNNGVLKVRNKSGLPLGYTLLDYIESTGTQYITSPITSVRNGTFYLDFQMVEVPSGFPTVWGAMPASSDYKVVFGSGGQKLYSQPGKDAGYVNTIDKDTNRHQATITTTENGETVVVDGQTFSNTFVITEDNTMPLTFFARQRYDGVANYAKVKLYSAWHKNSNNELDFSVIPCKNPSGVLGLYDLVNNQFYDNDGTGDFVAGNPVDDLEIYADGTQEVVTDAVGNTASAEMLLALSTYKDTQEIISGAITHNVGIKVYDGTENWMYAGGSDDGFYLERTEDIKANSVPMCTHFNGISYFSGDLQVRIGNSWGPMFRYTAMGTTVANWTQFLADQYAAGTPVIVVYPLATATTESVSPQVLTTEPITQTAGSLSGLGITATESTATVPTPSRPLDICCNNGVLKTTAPLPQSYTELEYIESTGTQYISPLITYAADTTLRAVADMQFTSITGSQYFGIYASAYCGVNANNFVIGGYGVTTADTNRHTFDLYSNIGGTNTITLKIDDATYTYSRDTNSGGFQILGLNGTNLCAAKLYSVKLYKNDNLVFNGMPAKRNSDNVIGMYDTVSQTFFMNAGTGTFTAGSELPFIYADGTQETISVHGKNLWTGNFNQFDNTGGLSGPYAYFKLPKENTYYTLSVTAKKDYTASATVALGFTGTGGDASDGLRFAISTSGTILKGETVAINNRYNSKFLNFVSMYKSDSATFDYISEYFDIQLEEGVDATDYAPYFNGGTATAEMLLKVGNYIDEHELIAGDVVRKVGVKVFDGTEGWVDIDGRHTCLAGVENILPSSAGGLCNYLPVWDPNNPSSNYIVWSSTLIEIGIPGTSIADLTAWLADQYNAGTPVILVYPLATPTTESVAGQTLQVTDGDNIADITQASMDGLELQVTYTAGVSLTIEEVQDAQLSPDVEVTIE